MVWIKNLGLKKVAKKIEGMMGFDIMSSLGWKLPEVSVRREV